MTKTADQYDQDAFFLRAAERLLRDAACYVPKKRARCSAAKIRSALKSVQGAIRNAERFAGGANA